MKEELTKWREEHIPKPPRKILVVQGTHGEHRPASPHKASLYRPSLQTVQPPPAKRDLRAPKHLFLMIQVIWKSSFQDSRSGDPPFLLLIFKNQISLHPKLPQFHVFFPIFLANPTFTTSLLCYIFAIETLLSENSISGKDFTLHKGFTSLNYFIVVATEMILRLQDYKPCLYFICCILQGKGLSLSSPIRCTFPRHPNTRTPPHSNKGHSRLSNHLFSQAWNKYLK